MKHSLRKIIVTAVTIEVAYLLLVNIALNVPLTQILINKIKPEKFSVYWEHAWSWYPFRVHARGISANGQARSQQWQVDTPAASASINMFPLLWRTVQLNNIIATDIEYFQRPRPKQGKDYSAINHYFPPIHDRAVETTASVLPPKKSGSGWKVVVNGARANGHHHVWINQLQASVSGTLHTDVRYQSRGGPFSLDNGKANILIDSLLINNNITLLRDGWFRGTVDFKPFVPSENRGLKSLVYLQVDADIGAQQQQLDFLGFYLNSLYDTNITGTGELSGHVRYAYGDLLPQTRLMISAQMLSLNARSYTADGAGNINISVNDASPDTTEMIIRFSEMQLLHEADSTPHFQGTGLELIARGTSKLFPRTGRRIGINYATISVPDVQVPDLRIYQRYLPGNKGVVLNGGQGTIQGQAELTTTSLTTILQLRSDAADISLQNYRFNSNLDLGLNIDIPSFASGKANISGTYVRLDKAKLINNQQQESDPWAAALTLDKGSIDLLSAKGTGSNTAAQRPSQIIMQSGFKTWLGQLDSDLGISGEISNLEWINLLFVNPYNMAVEGSGKLAASLHIRNGKAAQDSLLKVSGKALRVNILDYVVAGDGHIEINVAKGGDHPDLVLDVDIRDGLFHRKDENTAFIQDVILKLHGKVRGLILTDNKRKLDDLYLQIPSARVTDMSIYNQYLPKQSPLRLLGGEADLTSYIHLQSDSAAGYVKLNTEGLHSQLNDQELAGELTVDIKLSNGRPEDLEFDISGTQLTLNNIKVTGTEANHEQESWGANFIFDKGRVVWKKPVRIDADMAVEITDSRPFVALFSNEKGQRDWLDKMLTVENIQGRAKVILKNEQLIIPRAFVSSDKVDAGAKGIVAADRTDGMFYARFRKLDALLKIKDGEHNIDIIKARKTFDEYKPLKQ